MNFICENCQREFQTKRSIGNHKPYCHGTRKPVFDLGKKIFEGRWKGKKGKTLEELYGTEKAVAIKDKLSTSHIGQKSWNEGLKMSSKTKENMSSAHVKRLNKLSKEEKRNIAKPMLDVIANMVRTEEWKNNISKALKGKKPSNESIEKQKKSFLESDYYKKLLQNQEKKN
jgi:hypothetical protein